MMKQVIVLVALLGCDVKKKHQQPAPDPGALINAAHVIADRVCACQTDRDCLKGVRDEWDAQKDQMLGNAARIVGDDKTKFDAEINRIKMCGDAGGLTFWDH